MAHRILQIIPTLDRAGAEKQLTVLAEGLAQRGFDVHICALTRGGPYEQQLRGAGLPYSIIGKRWKADPLTFWRLKQHIARLQPDLVHTWLFAAGAYGRAAARAAGVEHLVAGERCVDHWKSAWQWAVDRRLAASTDRLVTNTTAVRDYCAAHGLPAEKFVVIPNGVPPARPSDVTRVALLDELQLPHHAKLIGAIGRLWPQKRIKDLIWAFELVHVLHADARFLIFGDGPLRRQLERYAKLVSGPDRVRFLGHREDVWRILPHLDVVWQASEYEGMPNSIMEAMAAGRPVILSDIPGHRDLVVDQESGLLVPIGDRAEFTRAAHALLVDAALAERMGRAGQARMAAIYPPETMIDRHARLYQELL